MYKKLLFLMFSVLSLLMFLNITDTSVQAKTVYTKKFPKSLCGTWYSYSKDYNGKHKLYKQVINSKRFRFHPYKKHKVYIGCQPKTKSGKIAYNKNQKWTYGISFTQGGHKWTKMYGWQQQAGCGYNYNVRRINGHKVLSIGDGAGNWIVGHYYTSKKLAIKMGDKHYHGFKYYPTITY
ncbi:hypothetical protein [Apilactobacillus ozensis]|uniref:hypothetical protein n=1 Tax=Apilactobacillus ozensis TaxID=866801 RepID=UPI00200AE58B|nr:hypothetical protein [Apilactobacillus ozensis]MCK8607003.1 hypothetical protein [Apilactobacillus ozensis]